MAPSLIQLISVPVRDSLRLDLIFNLTRLSGIRLNIVLDALREKSATAYAFVAVRALLRRFVRRGKLVVVGAYRLVSMVVAPFANGLSDRIV